MQVHQLFDVVRDAIAGYHCLLGQDFLNKQSCALLFTPKSVASAVNRSETEAGRIISQRKLMIIPSLSSVQNLSKVQNYINSVSVRNSVSELYSEYSASAHLSRINNKSI